MQTDASRPADTLTLVAIAVVVYATATLIHEGVGHGGACMLVGGKPLVLSTVHFECGDKGIGPVGQRLVAAGGTLANFLAGSLFLLVLRVAQSASGHLRYFFWLSMTVNLLQAAGYFLFSGVANIGDWSEVIRGLSPWWAWRAVLAICGGLLYVAFVRLALLKMAPLIGADDQRLARAKKLALVPYFTGGILSCVAALFNPIGMALVAISAAAASFGGTSGLAWMTEWLRSDRFRQSAAPPASIDRRWFWIATAALVAGLFVSILGPSIRFQ
jgi:hypothetical protein